MAMDETVVEMLNNKEFVNSLAKNALDRIKTEFVWKHQLEKLKKWLG